LIFSSFSRVRALDAREKKVSKKVHKEFSWGISRVMRCVCGLWKAHNNMNDEKASPSELHNPAAF
jgi:hypothetical protein